MELFPGLPPSSLIAGQPLVMRLPYKEVHPTINSWCFGWPLSHSLLLWLRWSPCVSHATIVPLCTHTLLYGTTNCVRRKVSILWLPAGLFCWTVHLENDTATSEKWYPAGFCKSNRRWSLVQRKLCILG